jgi:hypothetical protein
VKIVDYQALEFRSDSLRLLGGSRDFTPRTLQ